ncbi:MULTISPECIES: hypothetical protein [unclassified Pantoea]|uniref:hypothetical protein n=1 Tax=unclassified Pantoea TaxID=2630326 RepID=UPI001CD5D530|nr:MULTISPECIES: hypothetical protein [unclassified Pantoea]MCA1176666.1 hypothetical protein [Pantoea sp. alder69]MCA1251579.1 hypothetical protein [Pantoea sp. alder70]MCA1264290.1 hypothetical protein [Pantoea sp. alder81]
MKNELLHYIEKRFMDETNNPMEHLVYFIAKLSLTAKPVAWRVRRPGSEDMIFNCHKGAINFMKKHGNNNDSIVPLFEALKIDTSDKNANSR